MAVPSATQLRIWAEHTHRHCQPTLSTHRRATEHTRTHSVFCPKSVCGRQRERERERERESACVCVCRCPGAHNNSMDAMGAWEHMCMFQLRGIPGTTTTGTTSLCVCFSSVVLLVLLLLLLVLLVLLVLPALEVYWHNWHYWQVTIGTTGGWWLYAFYLRNPKAPYCHQRWVDTPVNRLTLFPSPSLLALLAGQVRLLLVLLVAGGCMHSICETQRPRIVIKGGLTLR